MALAEVTITTRESQTCRKDIEAKRVCVCFDQHKLLQLNAVERYFEHELYKANTKHTKTSKHSVSRYYRETLQTYLVQKLFNLGLVVWKPTTGLKSTEQKLTNISAFTAAMRLHLVDYYPLLGAQAASPKTPQRDTDLQEILHLNTTEMLTCKSPLPLNITEMLTCKSSPNWTP